MAVNGMRKVDDLGVGLSSSVGRVGEDEGDRQALQGREGGVVSAMARCRD